MSILTYVYFLGFNMFLFFYSPMLILFASDIFFLAKGDPTLARNMSNIGPILEIYWTNIGDLMEIY